MFVILFLIIYVPKLIKEAREDAEHRERNRKKGLDFYASSTGLRNVSDNKPYIRKK